MRIWNLIKVIVFFTILFGIAIGLTVVCFYLVPLTGVFLGIAFTIILFGFSVEPKWAARYNLHRAFIRHPRLFTHPKEQELDTLMQQSVNTYTLKTLLWGRTFATVFFLISAIILFICWKYFSNAYLLLFAIGHGVLSLWAGVKLLQTSKV